jgi:hypothetical protein
VRLLSDDAPRHQELTDPVSALSPEAAMSKRMVPITELATVVRSKNSGPFEFTFDIMFENKDNYEAVKKSGVITRELIAKLFAISDNRVLTCRSYDPAQAYKITIKRNVSAGDLGESDVYGSQQHVPLTSIQIPVD